MKIEPYVYRDLSPMPQSEVIINARWIPIYKDGELNGFNRVMEYNMPDDCGECHYCGKQYYGYPDCNCGEKTTKRTQEMERGMTDLQRLYDSINWDVKSDSWIERVLLPELDRNVGALNKQKEGATKSTQLLIAAGMILTNENIKQFILSHKNEWNTPASDGDNEPCYYCGKPCDNLSSNPGLWPVALCHKDEPGVSKYHHSECVSKRLEPARDGRGGDEEKLGQLAIKLIDAVQNHIASGATPLRTEVCRVLRPYLKQHQPVSADDIACLDDDIEEIKNTLQYLPKCERSTHMGAGSCHYCNVNAIVVRLKQKRAALQGETQDKGE